MLVKWFSCDVHDPVGFGRGQQGWSRLRGQQAGLLGQVGGWGQKQSNHAHILGCWTARQKYEEFMAGPHDDLAADQRGTYTSAHAGMFDHQRDIARPLPARLTAAGAIRVAHCFVRPERVEHFVDVQQRVWNPGMEMAEGMLGGSFSRQAENEFLVVTLWRSVADHQRYVEQMFPDLRVRSGAADDLASITGELIQVVPEWTFQGAELLG
ncbi:DUF4937 domain-containing protein [Phytoactinopolyspora endophytica]|uniref:DUF4937 domain-containing protein n=1 Tax=Phytoactinopolyspora endophytica TaxID=1642495 RepID=UPI00101E03AB|nr:DUF4937 domain-containing protein [Phytoactinopolyspora endophytica]